MQLVNRRNLIIAGGVVVLLIVIGSLFWAQQNRGNNTDTTENQETETVDQNSGETVSEIEGKTPETFGQLPNTPDYLNIDEFITNGLTSEQLNNLKYAFYKYTTAANPKIKQVSITKDSVVASTPNADGKQTAQFEVAFDGQSKIKGTLVYFDDSIELTLTDGAGKKVFESGTITGRSVYQDQP